MNKLISFFAGLLLAASLHAQSYIWKSGSATSSAATLLSTTVGFKYIQLTDTSGSANLVTIYDNSTASTNVVSAAYTAAVTYTTNVVESFTNLAGVAQSFTNTVLHTQTYTVAAATNEARVLYRVTVPASGTVTFSPSPGVNATRGLTVKATGNVNYTLQYYTLPF